MSKEEIKPGDQIRWKPNASGVRVNGALVVTAQHIGSEWCVFTWRNPSSGGSGEDIISRASWDAKIEKVPDFFEVGVTYELCGDRFTPTAVETNADGSLVAFGRATSPGSTDENLRWQSKKQFQYDAGWKEVVRA